MSRRRHRSAGDVDAHLTWRMPARDIDRLILHTTWPDVIRPQPNLRDWAWGGSTGAAVRVCVVDSGVEPDHPLVGPLEGAYAVEPDESGTLRVVPDSGGDTYGHGTACAGIIRRLAPDCQIISLRVLGGLFGGGDVLITGLRWVIEQGFDVVNLSLSTTKLQFGQILHQLADEAYFGNTLLVCSAHNSPVESFPWRFSSVVSVGSHAEADPWRYYYNPTPPVEFFAPGEKIPVAWRAGGQSVCTGNSFATPHIAGICALIRGKHRDLRPFQVKTLLYLTAENVRRNA